jgi:hypothetical protein
MNQGRSLRMRIPGQSVLGELISSYRETPKRSRLAVVFGASPLTAENRNWYRGALGELVVGRALDQLGPEWDVLHAVPVGSGASDIDHVVIGPAGVFTIDTKNHSGQDVRVAGTTFMVAGQRQPHIRNSQFEAARATRLLSAAVGTEVKTTPVLVVVDPKRLTIRATSAGVQVVTSRQLDRWLHRQPRVLTGDAVAAISDVADQASTWHSLPGADQDPQRLFEDFAAIRDEVRTAIRRRVLWGFAAFALAYTVLWTSLAMFVAQATGF